MSEYMEKKRRQPEFKTIFGLRYFFLRTYFFASIAIFYMVMHWGRSYLFLLFFLQVLYVSLYGELIGILTNRKKLIADQRFSASEIGINIFLLNLFLSGSIIWCVQLLQEQNAFHKMSGLFDAIYFSVITFITVGYGDIYPTTALAKAVCMEASISNLLILVVFVNFFIAKSSVKKNYKMDCVLKIVYMFENIADRVIICDKSLGGTKKTWLGWGNEYLRLLQENLCSNPELVKKLKQTIDDAKEQNSKKAVKDSAIDLTRIYINGREQFLLDGLYNDMEKYVIPSIHEVLKNKMFLIENENITETECKILRDIEFDYSFIVNAVSYSESRALDYLNSAFNDLQQYLSQLGYSSVNELEYSDGRDYTLSYAVLYEHIHISLLDDIKAFWNRIFPSKQ